MRMLRFRCALSGFWGFTSTVRPAFGNLTSYLVCYGGCAKGRIKTGASHWIVDAITAAYTSQGLEFPFHIRVYSTRVIASCAWLRGMSIQEICFAAGWSSQNTLPGFTSWTVSPWPPKCCRWVTDSRLCYLYSYVLLPHTVITLCSPLCYCCCLPCTQCSSSYTMYILLCTIMFCVDCCLTQLSLCSILTMLLFLLLPCFSAQHTLLLTRYANFVYLGFRRSLAYLHLSAASPPSSVAICGNCVCVCVLSSLECNLYRLLVASLTAGLNIVPITENSPWCLVKAREGTSPVTIVTSVPWERERDITEVAVLAARPVKRRSVSDSDVIWSRAPHFILPLSLSVFACDVHTSRQLASHLTGVSQ